MAFPCDNLHLEATNCYKENIGSMELHTGCVFLISVRERADSPDYDTFCRFTSDVGTQ